MRLRVGNHGASAAAKSFTVAVMALATFAQFASLAHEITVRHFRCAEHGELTHVVVLAGPVAEARASGQPDDALRAGDLETADAHDHCAVAFTIEGSARAPSAGGAIATVPPPPPTVFPAPAALAEGRAIVLASAPKTSPPSA
jgi:hypothetical protein